MPITLLNNNNNMQRRYAGIFSFNANKWWLPIGILPSNVIAAYQFKGVASEADALLNQNDTATYPLTKVSSPTWNQSNGFSIPATAAAGLNNNSIGMYLTVAVRYSDLDTSSNDVVGLIGSDQLNLLMAKGCTAPGGAYTYYKVPTCSTYYHSGGIVNSHKADAGYSNGVLICLPKYATHSPIMYMNGALQNISAYSWNYADNFYRVTIGQTYRKYQNNPAFGTIKIQAVVFYNVELNMSQVLELTEQMAAL